MNEIQGVRQTPPDSRLVRSSVAADSSSRALKQIVHSDKMIRIGRSKRPVKYNDLASLLLRFNDLDVRKQGLIDAENAARLIVATPAQLSLPGVGQGSGGVVTLRDADSDGTEGKKIPRIPVKMYVFKEVLQLRYPDASDDDVKRMAVTARILESQETDRRRSMGDVEACGQRATGVAEAARPPMAAASHRRKSLDVSIHV